MTALIATPYKQAGKGCQARVTASIHNLPPPWKSSVIHTRILHILINSAYSYVTQKTTVFGDLKHGYHKICELSKTHPHTHTHTITTIEVLLLIRQGWNQCMTNWFLPCWRGNAPALSPWVWPVTTAAINISTEVFLQTKLPSLPAKYQYVISFLLDYGFLRAKTM